MSQAVVTTSGTPCALFVRDSGGFYRAASQEQIVGEAKRLLAARVVASEPLSDPTMVKDYLMVQLADLEHEVFGVVYMDFHNHVLGIEHLFRGTISQTAVYPREVVKACLTRNASSIICFHNHPGGRSSEPSRADEMLTTALKASLALIDVRLLDHFVVCATSITSFAARGLL